jgi:sulfur transfer protein SufE
MDLTFDQIKNKLNLLSSSEAKFEYLIGLSYKLPIMPAELKNDKNKVAVCGTPTWIHISIVNGFMDIQADSVSQILKANLYVIRATCQGKTVQEYRKINTIELLNSLGLLSNVTASRYNGIHHIVMRLRKFCEK